MKALRNYLDKIKPNFEKGGKFEKMHSTFDAFETFLFTPNTTSKTGVHIHDAIDSKRTMSVVVMALIPALLFGIWNTGYQHFLALGQPDADFMQMVGYGLLKVLPIIVVSYVVGLGIEFIFAQIKGHEVAEGFLVSGMLIPLIVPADIPLWMVAVATAFAVIIGKEVFGGTGMNIWNPALVTRAFLFFAYPSKMSGDIIWVSGLTKGEGIVDGFSGATPLGNVISGNLSALPSTFDSFIGTIPGSIGETSTLAILIGAAILLFTGIGNWKIMLSVFVGGFLMAFTFHALGTSPGMQVDPIQQLCLGGFAFGAVFMATDPVTGARTERGKYIYGFLIGVFAILIRVINPAYPEGMMMAILLMNTFAPLIDHIIVQGNIKRRLKRAKVNA